MKLHVIFFSPTGRTRKVAEILAGGWEGEEVSSVDLLKAPGTLSSLHLTKDDLCLFVLPSFGGRVPAVVVPYLRMLKGNGALGILVAVFGNRAIDDTLLELHDILTADGIVCVAAIEAVAEHSLCRVFGAGRPDADDLHELEGYALRIREAIGKGKATAEVPLPGNRPFRSYGGVPFKPVATASCDHCGLCAKECPVQAIPLESPWETDASRCISCMHCVALCPRHARELPGEMAAAAREKLAAKCSGRKPNRLYL